MYHYIHVLTFCFLHNILNLCFTEQYVYRCINICFSILLFSRFSTKSEVNESIIHITLY